MEENEMLETSNETENTETETVEETQEGIKLTDTAETEETREEPVEEKEEVKKTFREILEENPEYLEEYQKEMDKAIKTRLNRKEKEYQREISKYKDTENVLRKTLEVQDGEDVNTKLREFYKEQGVELPEVYRPGLSEREIEILARAEAEDIIEDGYDAMVNEANRLARKEYKNLNDKEKVIFDTLAERLTAENDKKELKRLGAKEDLLKDEEFISFRKKFNSNVPMEEIYSLYKKQENKKTFENPGSMKNTKEQTKKTFYTDEEISKLTSAELDDPEVWEAVRNSMTSQR